MDPFPRTTHAARARNIIHITGDEERGYSVYRDCTRLCSEEPANRALPKMVAGLNSSVIETLGLFAIHAGVAGTADRIVAIPAASGHGKTTLTAALVRSGFEYLSDEALVFTDGGTVLPYPKPFALSEWSAEKLGMETQGEETLVTAADLGGEVGRGGRLTDLILAEYGHDEARIEPLPKSQAVVALIGYSFNHFKDPARAFRIATEVARDVNMWQLDYGHPLEAVELIREAPIDR